MHVKKIGLIIYLLFIFIAACSDDDGQSFTDDERATLYCNQIVDCEYKKFPTEYDSLEGCISFETRDLKDDRMDYYHYGMGECWEYYIDALDCFVQLSCKEIADGYTACQSLYTRYNDCEDMFYGEK